MSIRKSSDVFAAALMCGLLLAITTRPASAEPPEPVVRTFAFFIGLADPLPDFSSEKSRLIVVVPPSQTQVNNPIQFVNGTTWYFQDALHVTAGMQPTAGQFLWLSEPPPTGSIAFADAVSAPSVFFVRLCEGGDCDGDSANDGKYTVDDFNPDHVFVVFTATFSD